MIVLEILGVWVLLSVVTMLAFDRVKHAVMSASRR